MQSVTEIINAITVIDNVVKLPNIKLDKETYQEVAKKIQGIGGKWKGGKISGFVFLYDPSGLVEQLKQGKEINLKQEFQFFGTPDSLADKLVELADIKEGDKLQEPSAGQGAIIKAIRRKVPDATVDCFELMESNRYVLSKVDGVNLIGYDFSENQPKPFYDRIIANPPFTNNQDIKHIRLMYQWLNETGRLVSVASNSWRINQNKEPIEFKNWLKEVGGQLIEVDKGAFKESGTTVDTCITVIDKTGWKSSEAIEGFNLPEKAIKEHEKLESPEYYLNLIEENTKEMLVMIDKLKRILNE